MKPFTLLVKPACADCNLQCRYCFYLDRAAMYPAARRHRMAPAVAGQMIRSYLATEQPAYSFGWQGGEPTLMGLDFFKEVTRLQQQYGRRGAQVANGLQTNGTLLDDAWAEHLAEYNFLLGVSVDGPPEIHNRYRQYPRGRDTHAAVMKGIETLRRHKVEFNTLTLVTRANVQKPREVYRYLCDQGFLFHQYIECIEFDGHGALMPYSISGREWGEFLCEIYDEWLDRGDTRKVSIRLFDSILTMLVEGVANVCAMGRDCRRYFVVEWNGDIYPCDFFVAPELKLGNVREDAWEDLLASPLYAEFGARKRQWNAQCADCECLLFCGGCCPKNRPTRGADPTQLSVLCEGWKMFHAHARVGFGKLAAEIRAEHEAAAAAARRRRAAPSGGVGRNDPCPCGSGLKYKRCCGE